MPHEASHGTGGAQNPTEHAGRKLAAGRSSAHRRRQRPQKARVHTCSSCVVLPPMAFHTQGAEKISVLMPNAIRTWLRPCMAVEIRTRSSAGLESRARDQSRRLAERDRTPGLSTRRSTRARRGEFSRGEPFKVVDPEASIELIDGYMLRIILGLSVPSSDDKGNFKHSFFEAVIMFDKHQPARPIHDGQTVVIGGLFQDLNVTLSGFSTHASSDDSDDLIWDLFGSNGGGGGGGTVCCACAPVCGCGLC